MTALRGCRDREDVDEALDGLPENLDDTYHRILNSIVRPKDQKRAQRVLQLIAVSYRPLTIEQVADALTVDCEGEKVDPKKKMRNPYEILEICSSLIEISGCVLT